jgi:hypothetical protein
MALRCRYRNATPNSIESSEKAKSTLEASELPDQRQSRDEATGVGETGHAAGVVDVRIPGMSIMKPRGTTRRSSSKLKVVRSISD